MNNNLRLVINNSQKKINEIDFFEKEELQIILNLYAKMVSDGSWRDYGLSISSKQVSFSVFKNAAKIPDYWHKWKNFEEFIWIEKFIKKY